MSQKTSPVRSLPTRVSGGVPWWLWLILIVFGGGIAFTLVNRLIPEDPDQIFQEGLTAYQANDVEKLESTIKTLKKYPDHAAERQLLEGMLLFGRSKPLLAVPMFQTAAKEPKLRIKALTMLGSAYMRSNMAAECIEALETALQEDPDADDARLTLCVVLNGMFSWDEAQKHLAILKDRKYKPEVVCKLLGDIYAELGRPAEAATEYEEALKANPIDPTNSLKASAMVRCRLQTGDLSGLDEILPSLDSAAVRDTVLAMLQMEKNDPEKGLTILAATLHENPAEPNANLAYAMIMEKIGTKEKAIEAIAGLQQPLSIQTRNRRLLEVVVSLAKIAGDEKLAQVAQQNVDQLTTLESEFSAKLDEVIKTQDDAQARLDLGDMAVAIGRFELAGTIYRSILYIDKSQASAIEDRIKASHQIQPMLVPWVNSDAPIQTPDGSAEPMPTPEPAQGSDQPAPEKATTPEPDAKPAPDDAKKPDADAE